MGVPIEAKGWYSGTALVIAAGRGQMEVVGCLLDRFYSIIGSMNQFGERYASI